MKIGFIGCGNMASAVATGIYRHHPEVEFLTYTPSHTRAIELAKKINGEAKKSLEEILEADYLVIGCKPQQFNDLSKKLVKYNLSKKVFVSIMAAIPCVRIKESLGIKNVMRLMPSLPMNFDRGISLIFFDDVSMISNVKLFSNLLKKCSQVVQIDEEDNFNKVTTISASGPAYVYYFANIIQSKLESWGIPKDESRNMATSLFEGSSRQMSLTSDDLPDLIDKVTSKGGVTIEAINSFEKHNLHEKIGLSIENAVERSYEIESNIK